ncbi:uncharacterized protein LOC144622309 [Crassostrea virginica]
MMRKYSVRCAKKYLVLLSLAVIVVIGVQVVLHTHTLSHVHCIGILGHQYTSLVGYNGVTFHTLAELKKHEPSFLACLYEMYTRTLQYHCKKLRRFGEIPRKGWYVCLDFLKTSPHNCSVVSVNTVFDEFSFVKHVKKYCNTEYIKSQTRDIEKPLFDGEVDVLTFSITKASDFVSLKKTLDNYGNRVSQLLLEIHPPDKKYAAGLIELIFTVQDLYHRDFRLVWFDIPYSCVPFFNNRNTNCISLTYVRISSNGKHLSRAANDDSFLLPSEGDLKQISQVEVVRALYHEYLSTVQFHCKRVVRMGKVSDGGWDICHDFMFQPSLNSPCIVFSFGIQRDFSFDNDISNTYGCYVYSFDPSMGVEDHRHSDKVYFFNKGLYDKKMVLKRQGTFWPMDSMSGIRKQLNYAKTPITVLKMDIERSEWVALKQMLDTNQLNDVEQLLVEFHATVTKDKVLIMKRLYDIGFRIFWFHKNPYAAFYHEQIARSNANEISFINTKFLKQRGLL